MPVNPSDHKKTEEMLLSLKWQALIMLLEFPLYITLIVSGLLNICTMWKLLKYKRQCPFQSYCHCQHGCGKMEFALRKKKRLGNRKESANHSRRGIVYRHSCWQHCSWFCKEKDQLWSGVAATIPTHVYAQDMNFETTANNLPNSLGNLQGEVQSKQFGKPKPQAPSRSLKINDFEKKCLTCLLRAS